MTRFQKALSAEDAEESLSLTMIEMKNPH